MIIRVQRLDLNSSLVILEIGWFDGITAELRNIKVNPVSGEQRCDFGTKSALRGMWSIHSFSQNFANLFFHAVAIVPGTALKAHLDALFDISDDQLSHSDIMIS